MRYHAFQIHAECVDAVIAQHVVPTFGLHSALFRKRLAQAGMTMSTAATRRRCTGSVSHNLLLQSQVQAQAQSSQPLGTWSHSSAAASSPHDPILTLASHAIRTAFGCIVQTVSDCLQCRNELSLAQIASYLQDLNQRNKTLSGRTLESTITNRQIRAALLVLIQHSIVTVKKQEQRVTDLSEHTKSKPAGSLGSRAIYRYEPSAALNLLRHCRFIEYVRKVAGADAARVVEELLVAGRLRTVDLILCCRSAADRANSVPAESDSIADTTSNLNKANSPHGNAIEALAKLVNTGFVQAVESLDGDGVDTTADNQNDDGENEFEPSRKRPKVSDLSSPSSATGNAATNASGVTPDRDSLDTNSTGVEAALLHYIARNPLSTLRIDRVWRVNAAMFHDTLRACHVGKLVSERHGHVVAMAGSLVTAALKYRAHVRHAPQSQADQRAGGGSKPDTVFTVRDVLPHVQKTVRQAWEQKDGDVMVHWHKAWQTLSERTNPQVVRRVGDDTFEIALSSLTQYLTDRILYQVVLDRHGEVAARVASILLKHGFLESERLAEAAMVPAKDTREVLHHLFRSRYVELVQLSSNSRQYNPANSIYAWGVERSRLRRNITDHVAKALGNIRLRREHEVEVIGKNWMERAQQAADTDENDHEMDKRNYQRFCLGLERLDVAAIQLDETLMALCDF